MNDEASAPGPVGSPVDRGVGRLEPERECVECGGPLQWRCPACRIAQSRAVADMTTAELRAEIGRMQRELIRRVCGDPVQGVGLKVRPSYCNRGNHCPWTDGDPSFCRACGERAQGSGQ